MMDDRAAIPLIFILVVVGAVLLLGGWIIVALTMNAMLAILLVGAGVYLFVRPQGLDGQMKTYVPLLLIIIGVLLYAGVFDRIL